ncbi:hypothetical protein IFM89_027846 [Coptis chinensis]|uniref:Uncharacterized protein n=1 Tax=Coptis chinensis TaxID=261450 RepID=A0A835HHU1_9MAGN|nr:hypothetical protein IFM89_027846 [Coptis chinensis]
MLTGQVKSRLIEVLTALVTRHREAISKVTNEEVGRLVIMSSIVITLGRSSLTFFIIVGLLVSFPLGERFCSILGSLFRVHSELESALS